MQKSILILFLISTIQFSFAQTLELEEDYLNNLIQQDNITTQQAQELGRSWKKLLAEFDGFPKLPYNEETKSVEFFFTSEFPGISKAELINRLEEWIAINYGSINEVLHYKNEATGKLIVKGFASIPFMGVGYRLFGNTYQTVESATCNHATIFTVKDGKIKMEFRNIEYEFRTKGYSLSGQYFPSEVITSDLTYIFPITSGEKETWKSLLSLISNTNTEIQGTVLSINRYIKNSKQYNSF